MHFAIFISSIPGMSFTSMSLKTNFLQVRPVTIDLPIKRTSMQQRDSIKRVFDITTISKSSLQCSQHAALPSWSHAPPRPIRMHQRSIIVPANCICIRVPGALVGLLTSRFFTIVPRLRRDVGHHLMQMSFSARRESPKLVQYYFRRLLSASRQWRESSIL